MIEKKLADIESKVGRAAYIEWKDGRKSGIEKRPSGFAYLLFTNFAIVPVECRETPAPHEELTHAVDYQSPEA